MSDYHAVIVFPERTKRGKPKKNAWRWHEVKSSDIVAESGESYKDKAYAYKAAKEHAPEGVPIHVITTLRHRQPDEPPDDAA